MKTTKREFSLYSFYDHTGIEAHLTAMAARGWLLEKMDLWGWRYRRTEPRRLRFAVVYAPDGSAFDPDEPTEEARAFQEYCAAAGWCPAAAQAQMRVFYHEDPAAVPMETDAAAQVETIHRAMGKNFLPGSFLLCALAAAQVLLLLRRFRANPLDALSSISDWLGPLIWLLLILLCAADIGGYFRWRRRALKAAERGEFLPTRSHPWLQRALLVLVGLGMLLWAASLLSQRRGDSLVVGLACGATALLAPRLVLTSLKRRERSADAIRPLYFLSTVVLAVVFTVLLALLVPRVVPLLRSSAEPYEYQGRIYTAYHDPLPLTVEDLGQGDDDFYSTRRLLSASPLLAKAEYTQNPRLDGPEGPSLGYTVYDVRSPFLYGFVRQRALFDATHDARTLLPKERRDRWQAVDAAPWGADEALRLSAWDGTPRRLWFLAYGRRLVLLGASWELTAEQMAAAAEKLAP